VIAVIADDFSGAAEVAGWAVAAGFTAEIRRDFALAPDNRHDRDDGPDGPDGGRLSTVEPPLATAAEVVVFDTDSRSLDSARAAARVRAAASWLRANGIDTVFKKIDSVLRGHVAAESLACLHALGRRRALLVPANPRRQRTVRDGQYRVAGQPLHRTAFAHDPDFPATSDQVVDLLARHSSRPDDNHATDDAQDREGIRAVVAPCVRSNANLPNANPSTAPWPPAALIVGDASTPVELEAWAARLDSDTLPIGAAEFFAAWLATLVDRSPRGDRGSPRSLQANESPERRPRTLLVCGSPAAWFQGRAADAQARRLPVLRWTGATAAAGPVNKTDADAKRLATARDTLASVGRLLVTCHDEDTPSGQSRSTEELLRALAAFARQVLAPLLDAVHPSDGRPLVERLLVEGGATTAALVSELAWVRFQAAAPVAEGITPLIPERGARREKGASEPRCMLFSKPGSYAWPANLW
jgi:uncharacterized protein YgbK (DUF1537 family)